ncbi:hypothetical protein D3C80_2199300 [compost metagenome]
MLIQITVTHSRCPFYFSAILQQCSGQNIHQRRFADAIRSHHSNMLAGQQAKGHIRK